MSKLSGEIWGILIALCIPLSWAFFSLLIGPPMKRHTPMRINAVVLPGDGGRGARDRLHLAREPGLRRARHARVDLPRLLRPRHARDHEPALVPGRRHGSAPPSPRTSSTCNPSAPPSSRGSCSGRRSRSIQVLGGIGIARGDRHLAGPGSRPDAAIAGGGEDNKIYLGALLELLLIIANVGTAVVVFPILRRQNEVLALGYVTARIVECAFIAAGIIFVLGIVSLRQDSPDAPRSPYRSLRSRIGRSCSGPASSSAGGTG